MEPKNNVTLRDVAQAAGVHPGTASRALNEATRWMVRPETVERVMASAEALGYKPNLLARSFKTRRTHSVGVAVPDITYPLFPSAVRAIEDRLATGGYVALLANTGDDPERQRRVLSGMLDRRVDGLIVATSRRTDPNLAELVDHGVPVVLINRVSHEALSSVSVDDESGIRMAVNHVCGLGHVRIAHIAGPQSMIAGFARYGAFVAAMTAQGMPVEKPLVSFADQFSIAEGERCGAELLKALPRPTAIVTANDLLALGCYSALEAAGLRCPGDVSVVGYNDMPLVDRANPPLTTVHVPHYDVGMHAAELLLDRMVHPDLPPWAIQLSPSFVVRGSTAGAPLSARVPTC